MALSKIEAVYSVDSFQKDSFFEYNIHNLSLTGGPRYDSACYLANNIAIFATSLEHDFKAKFVKLTLEFFE